MAQINFPTATSNGQTFEADNGVIYTYVGTPPNGFWSGSFQATGLTTLDARFLKLDSSNDPITGGLNITSGNVGIGTSSPIAQVTARGINSGGQGGTMCIQNTGSGVNTNVALYLTPNNGGGNDLARTAAIKSRQDVVGNYANLEFYTSESNTPTERMCILSSGNIGIGTSSPSRLVHIKGSGNEQQNLFLESTTTNSRIEFINTQTTSTGNRVAVGARNDSFSVNIGSSLSAKLVVNPNGNVGIGTTSPAQKLDINGKYARVGDGTSTGIIQYGSNSNSSSNFHLGSASGVFRLWNGDIGAGTELLRILSNGSVGIGTTSPGGALEVQTASSEGVLFDSAGGSQQPRITLMRSSGANYSLTNDLGELKIHKDSSEIYKFVGGNTHRFTGTGQFNKPTNWWSSSAFFGIPGLGHLGTEGSYRVALTSNGYRSTSGWVSLNANNQTGAAQIGCDPIGKIIFGTEANKAAGSSGSATTRMLIDTTGTLLIHQFSSATPGKNNTTQGTAIQNHSDGSCLFVSRGTGVSGSFNRNGDGDIIRFRRNGAEQGDIRVSGSTVTYAGGHLSRFAQLKDNGDRIEILRGSVLSNIDQMCVWDYDAKDAELWTEDDEIPEGANVGDVKIPASEAGTELNEQLNRMKVSDVEGDPNVSGVFEDWDDDDEIYTKDFFCAMTGDFVIRIAQGTTVARGDLLMSAGDGTAKPQEDDIVRSKTIAKVSSTVITETYADGSYIVPCVLMVC